MSVKWRPVVGSSKIKSVDFCIGDLIFEICDLIAALSLPLMRFSLGALVFAFDSSWQSLMR